MNPSRLPRLSWSLLGFSFAVFAATAVAQDEEPASISFPAPAGTEAAPAATTAPATPSAPAPLRTIDFMRSPLVRSPDLNSSGSHVAALFSGGGETYQLIVRDRATASDITLGGGDAAMVDSFRWLDDTHIAYNLVSYDGRDVGLMIADITDPGNAYPIYQYGAARIVAIRSDTPLQPLVWVSVGAEDGSPAVVELDAATNRGGFIDIRDENETEGLVEVAQRHSDTILSVVPMPEGDQLGYLPDGSGSLGYAYTVIDDEVFMHVWDGKEWFLSPLDFTRADVVDVGNEPGQLVMVIEGAPGETSTLRFVDAVAGTLGEVLLQDSEYDFNGSVFRDPASRSIVGAFYDRNGPNSTWFDEGYREVQKALNGYFPGKVVRLVDVSDDGNVMLVAVTSDRDPIGYFTIDLDAKKIDVVQGERPWLPGNRLSPTSILKYTTSDGKKLDAYVTLPQGTSKANPAPLIVLPHGGPWARSTWGFDSEAQLLAYNGYAVIQPNYRGSTSYNWMFTPEERGDLTMMHDDVTQAVRTVIKTGMIDANRIGISGGGFGGYLAITGLVEESDLYSCGVTVSGVFDWQRVANEIGLDREQNQVYGQLFTLLGDPGSEAAKYDLISSGRRVNQIDAPVLVVTDKDAQTVEGQEARELIDDLLSAGVSHEVHEVEISILLLESRVALFDRMLDFFGKNLK
ncbi:prolyl oligopeptidase family serine peptidase [Opitutaceae bacterium]|nr:prolyl oligopeptidase family serine peptidase [Opitutaceae bacterium]